MAEQLCWDCPRRSGVSRHIGKLMQFYYGFKENGNEIIEQQKGECVGRVPVKVLSQFGIRDEVGEDEVTTIREGHTLYLAGCASSLEEVPEVSEDVSIGFGFSGKTHYAEPIREETTIPRAEYDATQARLRESHRAIVDSMSID